MKKLVLFSCVALSLAIVSCNNKPKEEELPIDEAVEQMTDAVMPDSTTVEAAAPMDSANSTPEAAH